MFNHVPHKVLLPKWIWEEAQSNEHFKELVIKYIRKSYPDYSIKKVKKPFAICVRK
jgi:hypothetical protein